MDLKSPTLTSNVAPTRRLRKSTGTHSSYCVGFRCTLREGPFYIGGAAWAGGSGEGSSVKFLKIGEGQTCFVVRSRGRVTFVSARKKLLHVASIKVDSFICQQTCEVFEKLKLVCTSKATSRDQSKLFTGVEKLYWKTIISQLT